MNNNPINTLDRRQSGHGSWTRLRTMAQQGSQLIGESGASNIVINHRKQQGSSDGWAESQGNNCSVGTFEVVSESEGVFAGDAKNINGCTSNSASKDNTPIMKMMSNVISNDEFCVGVCESGCLQVSISERHCSTPKSFCVNLDCVAGTCTCIHMVSGCVCQLKPCRFFAAACLMGELDTDLMFIMRGIVFGFHVIDDEFVGTYECRTVKKRLGWESDLIEEKLLSELDRGLLSRVQAPPDCVHSLFVVPKDGGGGRIVIDCSKPKGRSVNSATSTVAKKFKYQSVDNVIEEVEQGDFMASIDIKDAYRAVHIHPGDRSRQGLKWVFGDEQSTTYMVDNRLCMGLSSSPYIFTRISNFIVRCARREGIGRITNYLDDFCIVGGSWQDTSESQNKLIRILRRLGFFISFKKLQSPVNKLRFLGIYIDSISLELSLPEDKLDKLRVILCQFQNRTRAKRRDLERLGGLLAHCAKVIRGGRTFCRRIYDLIASLREPHHYSRLNKGFREDITWWASFASTFNGKAGILGRFTPTMAVYSDASDWGMAAAHSDDWVVGSFIERDDRALGEYVGHHHEAPEPHIRDAHINIKEMGAVYMGACRWAQGWKDTVIIFITDSAVVEASLNTGRSRSPIIMGFLRRLFWLSVQYNFTFISTYINTRVNTMCDALSRLDKEESAERIREVDQAGRLCCGKLFDYPFSAYLQDYRN